MLFAMLHETAESRHHGTANGIGTGQKGRNGLVEKLVGHAVLHVAFLLKQAGNGEEATDLGQLAFVRYPTESLGGCIGQVLERFIDVSSAISTVGMVSIHMSAISGRKVSTG